MDDRIRQLYFLPESVFPQNYHVQELRQYAEQLEAQLLDLAQTLPENQRQTAEAYIDIRDELEFETVKIAMKYGKHLR